MNDLPILSLDLETTGLEIGKHVPISIGAAFVEHEDLRLTDRNSFYAQLEWADPEKTDEAMSINGLDLDNPPGRNAPFYLRSLPAYEAISEFQTWLSGHGDMEIMVLGKNVGSFDLPMLHSVWPQASSWPFSYRSIDLNSIFYFVSTLEGMPFDFIKKDIEKRATKICDRKFSAINAEVSSHHALYDAWWNIFALTEARGRMMRVPT